jgi:acyl carrier protein
LARPAGQFHRSAAGAAVIVRSPLDIAVNTPAVPPFSSPPLELADDPQLREALKRCSPATFEAARTFRTNRDLDQLPVIIHGVIERYVEPELRPRLRDQAEELRLVEDLGLDSLSLLEVVLLAEDVLQVSLSADELRHCHTVADVRQFLEWKVRGLPAAAAVWVAVT